MAVLISLPKHFYLELTVNNLPIFIIHCIRFSSSGPFFFFLMEKYNSLRGSGSLFNYNKCMVVICPQSTLADFTALFALQTPKRHLKNTPLCFKYLLKPPDKTLPLSTRGFERAKRANGSSEEQFRRWCVRFLSVLDDLANSHVDIIPQ